MNGTKFWLLTTEYPPQSGGGISTYCWHTALMLAAADFEVTIFIPAKQSQTRKILIQEEKIRLIYFRQNNNPQNSFLGYEAALSYEFSKVLNEFEKAEGSPDFVESQEYGGIAYYPLQRRLLEENFLKSTVFYITAHAPSFLYLDYNEAPSYQFPEYWIGEMEKSVLRSADFIISPSHYLLDKLKDYVDLASNESFVLQNPFSSSNEVGDFLTGDLVFFGKLTPQKGGLEMLNYFQDLWDEGFKHSLRIIGGGDHFFYPKVMDMGKYVRKTYAKYIKNGLLIFEGHISPEKIEGCLSNAHVVIVPSTVDNLPYTVLEAMSMGKVVFASQQGGHAELIDHGRNGFLFSHEIPDNFNHVLKEILSLPKERILEIGSNAGKTVQRKCSYEFILEKKLSIISGRSAKKLSEFPFIRPCKPLESHLGGEGQEKGLLSIVIPFYNLGLYVEDCLKSIYESDYPNKEVIVVNDGSTDIESKEVLRSVEEKYSLRIIHQRNQGLCFSRNVGARAAKGEYLAFLDADDTVNIPYFSKAIQVLEKYKNVSFVGCWAQYFGASDNIWPAFNPEPPYLLTHNTMNSSAIICRRDSFLEVGGNDPSMIYGMEDYETVINMVKNGFHGVVLPEVLWNYRIRSGSMAQSFNHYSELYLYRLISRKHSDFYREYAEEVVNILNANGPGMRYKNPSKPASGLAKMFAKDSKIITLIRGNKFLRKLAKIIVKKIV